MNLKSVKKRIKDSQRSVSYGELADLEDEFDAQVAEKGLELDEETRSIMLSDFVQQYIDGDDDPKIGDSKKIKDAKKAPMTCLEYVLENADLSEFTKDLLNDCEYALDDMENISKNELESIADRYINENSDVIYTSSAEEYIRDHGGYKRAMQVLKSYGYDIAQADDVELVASLMCMEDHQSDWAGDIDDIMSCIEDYVDEYSSEEDED